MFFAIDIDGTIAHDERDRGYARYLNRMLHLGMRDEVLEQIETLADLFCLPEVEAFVRREPDAEQLWRGALKQAQHDAEVQEGLVPLPGAVEGVKTLATLGTVAYITCRRGESWERTSQWLKRHGFPAAERLFPCAHYHDKYVAVFMQAASREPVVFIDDRVPDLIRSFKRLVGEQKEVAVSLYRRMGLLAFGYEALPERLPSSFVSRVPVGVLPSWTQLESCLLKDMEGAYGPVVFWLGQG
uniref:Haloacid dehalogenase n=1 Tax=Thermosporothrix sp. COM3 TaxID=2490863 RepID=A0A455SDZ1_9CHLR|nr:hypothetical protein KTC_00100 [Thermosporothrix sp. COM3]